MTVQEGHLSAPVQTLSDAAIAHRRLRGAPGGNDNRSGHRGEAKRRTSVLHTFFVLQIISCIFLQKIGLPVGGAVIPVALPIYFISLSLVFIFHGISLDPVRLTLYVALVAAALLAQALGGQPFSAPGFILFLVTYLAFLPRYDVDESEFRRVLEFFLSSVLVLCAITALQNLAQITIGAQWWPNMERLIPAPLTVPQYNYLQPMSWGSKFWKPNAFFIVEVSFLSQMIMLAFVTELVFFQRIARLAVYGASLILCFAGTGILILLMCAPFLIARLPARMMLLGGILTVIVGVIAVASGLIAPLLERTSEFTTGGTSGYYRYTIPLQLLGEMARDPGFVFHGLGAGKTEGGGSLLLLSGVKLTYEYGFLTALLYFVFFIHATFVGAPSKRVSLAYFLFINVGGGALTTPFVTMLIATMVTNLRIARPFSGPSLVE